MNTEEEHQEPDEATLDSIRRNVEYVKTRFSETLGVTLDFNSESIEWIDGYIDRNGKKLNTVKLRDGMTNILGSFLGETIIEVYGGDWRVNHENLLGIRFDNNSWAFPFSKTHKHFKNGQVDSIYSFFKMVPRFLDNSLTNDRKTK